MTPIRRVAVLGAGTMGSRIAAHFGNAGVPTILVDVDAATVQRGISGAIKSKAFYDAAAQSLVRPGALEDIAACDWVLEAVTENLAVKRGLLSRIPRKPGAIVSTNTSGIPLAAISEGFPLEFRQHFLGTHFFNPPRYLHLLELIRGVDTLPAVADFVREFADRRLGKGVVECRDTPNFIANRIGCFFVSLVQRLTLEGDFTIEEADLLTGPLIGLPKSATYRLLDIVGIDVWDHVTRNLDEAASAPFLLELIRRGWLGDKSGQGCYKKLPTGEIQTLDLKTLEYRAAQKPCFASAAAALQIDDPGARLRFLAASNDRAGQFIATLLTETIAYSKAKLPLIAKEPMDIDRAMRWGYNWAMGPFEMEAALANTAPAIPKPTPTPAPYLEQVLAFIENEQWDALEAFLADLQQANLSYKYSAQPQVISVSNLTTGIAAQRALHATRIQASAELYFGFDDLSAGLIPAAGGCKELLIRNSATAFDLVFTGKISTSARGAANLGYLRPQDAISMNPDRLLDDARALEAHLAIHHVPPLPDCEIATADPARMQLAIYLASQGEFITPYDAVVAGKLAHVLSGGGKPSATEQQLLDLEREAFLSLCGRRETQLRLQHLLSTGKPLKN